MIAIDGNLLVYAHRADSEWHAAVLKALVSLAEGRSRWAVPWTCAHEFLAIVTHPRIYVPASTSKEALGSLAVWPESPSCVPAGEGPGCFEQFARPVSAGKATGGLIHDARVAAVCIHNGVSVLWTAGRDFGRFVSLKTFNPLVG